MWDLFFHYILPISLMGAFFGFAVMVLRFAFGDQTARIHNKLDIVEK
jgi:hypothetical protein